MYFHASAIMLSRIKLGFPEIRKALLDVDDRKLSVDDLKAISRQLPTSEEVMTSLKAMSIISDFVVGWANQRLPRSEQTCKG